MDFPQWLAESQRDAAIITYRPPPLAVMVVFNLRRWVSFPTDAIRDPDTGPSFGARPDSEAAKEGRAEMVARRQYKTSGPMNYTAEELSLRFRIRDGKVVKSMGIKAI